MYLNTAATHLFTALRNALHDEGASAEARLHKAAAILKTAEGSQRPASSLVPGGLAPWQIRRVTSHIETNLNSPIRNEALAAVVRLSSCHFARAFRNSLGHSPHEYVVQRRIERAQELMLSTQASLSQIAVDCGLADQAHLCRLFRRVVGESPKAWRRARVHDWNPQDPGSLSLTSG